MSTLSTRTTLSITAVIAAMAVAGCGGSSGGGSGQKADGAGNAATPVTPSPSVGLGHAIFTTNNTNAAPKKGALDRLANGAPAPGQLAQGGSGRESLVAGAPDTGILDQLPQPEGLGAATKVCAAASEAPSGGNLAKVSRAVLCLLNAQRTSRGLAPLKPNKRLAQAAIAHSRNMVARHYFAHEGPDGSPVSRIKKAHYIPRFGFWTIGENLAYGTGSAAPAGQIMNAWMNSPEHKANILTAGFKEIGIGIVPAAPTGGGAGATFTTDFGGIRKH